MITLGLDPSLTGFGWAIHNADVCGPTRVVAKGVISTPASDVFVRRYMYLRESLKRILRAYPEVLTIGSESPPFGEQFSEGLYGLFIAVTEAVYSERRDIVFFDPSTVKSLAKMDPAIRKGTMDKRDMIDAARADTTIKKWDHNEADAYIVARTAARFWQHLEGALLEDELTPAEHRTFRYRHTITKGPRKGHEEVRGLIFREDDRFFRFSRLGPQDIALNLPTFGVDSSISQENSA